MANAAPAATCYYLSDLLKSKVRFEGDAASTGRLSDIGFRTTAAYPPATSLEVSTRRGVVAFPWSAVVIFSAKEIVLGKANGQPAPADFWVRRDVLDDQVVDLRGAKVRRVNDVQLLYAEGTLVAAHVEVGVRGILRRLGVERPVLALLHWLLDYTLPERFVTWRYVEVVSPGGLPGGVRLSARSDLLADLHPAEVADILEELGLRERQTLLGKMDPETVAGAMEEVTADVQRTLLSHQEPGKAANILEEMPATDAADALRELSGPEAQRIISRMEGEAAQDVRELLAHEAESAGSVMATHCIEARPDQDAASVLASIRPMAEEVGVFNIVYVLDDAGRLVGVVSLRELFAASPDAHVDSLMATHIISVEPDTPLRDLGRLFAKFGLRAIPVVDDQGVLLGAVRLKDVLLELAPLIKE
jgi:magnesium transporter